jgi:hypothetical protein
VAAYVHYCRRNRRTYVHPHSQSDQNHRSHSGQNPLWNRQSLLWLKSGRPQVQLHSQYCGHSDNRRPSACVHGGTDVMITRLAVTVAVVVYDGLPTADWHCHCLDDNDTDAGSDCDCTHLLLMCLPRLQHLGSINTEK